MTRLIHPGSLRRALVMLGFAIGLAGCSQAAIQHGKDSQMTQPNMTLWQTIDALVQQIPFSRAKVENVLVTHLVERDTSGDPFPSTAFQPYTGGPVRLADGVVIRNVDLRILHRAGDPGLLVLNLGGNCISLEQVRAHYSDLKLTKPPRPDSIDTSTGYSVFPSWGRLSFSFPVRNPDCLAYVAFAPTSPEADSAAKR